MHGAVLAHALDVPPGHLVFVLGEDRQPLDRLELRLIRRALRVGHMLERLAQADGALLAHRLEMRVIALQLVLRHLHLEQRCRPHAQLGLVHRFGDEVVRACFDRVQPMLPGLERRHHDDGHVPPCRILTNAAAHVEAVEPGHDDVEEDQIDAELQLRQPFDAVASRFDVVPQAFDEQLRDSANALVVVDDEHAPAADARRRLCARCRRRVADRHAFGPPHERFADGFDAGLDLQDDRRDVLQRALARGLDQLRARARDGIGADDGDAALERVGGAIERLAIAARGGSANGLELARALAHERVDELRNQTSRPARLEAAQVPRYFACRIG